MCCESGLYSSVRGCSREGVIYRDPEVYIGRQLRALFCSEEFSFTSLLVGCLNKVESLPIWLVYMVPPVAAFSFTVRSTSSLNSC
jgi:hypothetical protein